MRHCDRQNVVWVQSHDSEEEAVAVVDLELWQREAGSQPPGGRGGFLEQVA